MKLAKVFSKYELEDGALIPRGYGFAYMEYPGAKAVFYPIPINLLVNLHRKIQELITYPSPPRLSRLLYRAYMKGRYDGFRMKEQELQRTLEEFLAKGRRA